MKTYKYKILVVLLMVAFGLKAQTFDKKIEESFKVNPDVNIVVSTSHSDVEIDTWNRNEVSIEAVIEVEGVSEKEAKKLMDKWNFEALGNKSKVKVTSLANNFFFGNNFRFEHNVEVPEMHIEIPDFPEIEIEELHLPEMDFPEFEIEIPEMEIEAYSFDYDTYKKDSTYLRKYKERIQKQVEFFKNSSWHKRMDSLRNSEGYKKKMEAFKKQSKEYAKKLKESKWYRDVEQMRNSEEFEKMVEDSKKAAEDIRRSFFDNEELKNEMQRAREESKKARKEFIKQFKEHKGDSLVNFNYQYSYSSSDPKSNSKVKITKKIKIKVPKKATFNLNVRHGKLKVPKSYNKMSATISYGNFIGGIIEGEKNNITFINSPVNINAVNSGNITLKNVPNASFGTFSNASLFSNSSNVIIDEVGENVALSQKFGKLQVLKVIPEFKKLNIVLDYTKGNLDLSNAEYVFHINEKKSTIDLSQLLEEIQNKTSNGVNVISGFHKNKNALNKLILTAVYSTATVD